MLRKRRSLSASPSSACLFGCHAVSVTLKVLLPSSSFIKRRLFLYSSLRANLSLIVSDRRSILIHTPMTQTRHELDTRFAFQRDARVTLTCQPPALVM